jgi:hypothetical protein
MLEPFYVKGETGEKDFEQPQTLWYRKNRANNKDLKLPIAKMGFVP